MHGAPPRNMGEALEPWRQRVTPVRHCSRPVTGGARRRQPPGDTAPSRDFRAQVGLFDTCRSAGRRSSINFGAEGVVRRDRPEGGHPETAAPRGQATRRANRTRTSGPPQIGRYRAGAPLKSGTRTVDGADARQAIASSRLKRRISARRRRLEPLQPTRRGSRRQSQLRRRLGRCAASAGADSARAPPACPAFICCDPVGEVSVSGYGTERWHARCRAALLSRHGDRSYDRLCEPGAAPILRRRSNRRLAARQSTGAHCALNTTICIAVLIGRVNRLVRSWQIRCCSFASAGRSLSEAGGHCEIH